MSRAVTADDDDNNSRSRPIIATTVEAEEAAVTNLPPPVSLQPADANTDAAKSCRHQDREPSNLVLECETLALGQQQASPPALHTRVIEINNRHIQVQQIQIKTELLSTTPTLPLPTEPIARWIQETTTALLHADDGDGDGDDESFTDHQDDHHLDLHLQASPPPRPQIPDNAAYAASFDDSQQHRHRQLETPVSQKRANIVDAVALLRKVLSECANMAVFRINQQIEERDSQGQSAKLTAEGKRLENELTELVGHLQALQREQSVHDMGALLHAYAGGARCG